VPNNIVDDEKVFLIDEAMRFKRGLSAGATTFTWVILSTVSSLLRFTVVGHVCGVIIDHISSSHLCGFRKTPD